MNTTLQKIQDHREVYWKFARAGDEPFYFGEWGWFSLGNEKYNKPEVKNVSFNYISKGI